MKKSKYNMFVDVEGKQIVHNTLTGTIAALSGPLCDKIKNSQFDLIDSPTKETLQDIGILIDDDLSEESVILHNRDQYRYRTAGLNVVIIPTYNCNLNCVYCQVDKSSRKVMSEETKEAVIKFLKKRLIKYHYKALEISFYGGEPFVAFPTLIDITRQMSAFCDKKNIYFRIGIFTNGVHVENKQVFELLPYNIKRMQVSLDGPKEIHDKRRPFPNKSDSTYDKVMDSIVRFKEADFNTLIAINIDRENYPHMDTLFQDLKSRGLSDVHLIFGAVSSKRKACRTYQSCHDADESAQLLPNIWKKASEYGFKQDFQVLNFPIFCGYQTFSNFVVDPFGDLYKCYIVCGAKEHRCGNIAEDGNIKLLPPYYNWMSKDGFKIEKCVDCIMLPNCNGGCNATAYWDYSTYQAPACQGIELTTRQLLNAFATDKMSELTHIGEQEQIKILKGVNDYNQFEINPCGCEKKQPQPVLDYRFEK